MVLHPKGLEGVPPQAGQSLTLEGRQSVGSRRGLLSRVRDWESRRGGWADGLALEHPYSRGLIKEPGKGPQVLRSPHLF